MNTPFNVANLIIRPDNAFIPGSVAAGLTPGATFRLGSMNADLPVISTDNERTVGRYVAGATGVFAAFDTDWHWDAYYQRGITRVASRAPDVTIKSNFSKAMDAVRDAGGHIVCRSTLTNPNDGCVPYNLFGIGVNTSAALDYVLGDAQRNERFTQDVASASVQGEPCSSWSGPVSVAGGVEYRKEQVTGTSDPISRSNGFFAGNYLPTNGSYHVAEGFFETVVPLAKDLPGAEKLDFNGAVRFTDYSTSGNVVTWKAGLVYSPVADVTFRATRSRDIRAPNLLELFQAGGANTNNVIDPFNNNTSIAYQGLAVGNLALEPEKADTTGLGVVYQPSWAPGLSASIDYYKIDVKDAIATVLQQQIIDRCFGGDTALCAAIVRDVSGVVTQIAVQPINLSSEVAEGLDLEASYRRSLWNGELSLRALATHVIRRRLDDGILVTDLAGDNAAGVTTTAEGSAADWRFLGVIGYDHGSYAVTLIGRGVSAGVLDNANIQCASGCPSAGSNRRTIDDNHVEGALYADLSLVYRPLQGHKMDLFLKVDNIADTAPPALPSNGTLVFIDSGTNPLLYDTVGRTLRAGVRFL